MSKQTAKTPPRNGEGNHAEGSGGGVKPPRNGEGDRAEGSGGGVKPPRNGEGDRAEGSGGGVLSATPQAFRLAKQQRRSNNLPEMLLWRELRKRPGGHKFRRQHPLGSVVLDFACLARRVAIEVDGFSHDCGDRPQRDSRRDAWLRSMGFAVLRLPARDVLGDLPSSIAGIVAFCDERAPLHHTLRGGPPPRTGEVFVHGLRMCGRSTKRL